MKCTHFGLRHSGHSIVNSVLSKKMSFETNCKSMFILYFSLKYNIVIFKELLILSKFGMSLDFAHKGLPAEVGSKSHCRAVPSPIWCASNLIFIDDVSFKL